MPCISITNAIGEHRYSNGNNIVSTIPPFTVLSTDSQFLPLAISGGRASQKFSALVKAPRFVTGRAYLIPRSEKTRWN